MRTFLLLAAVPMVALAVGCSKHDDEDRNAAAAVAAGFQPPTVLSRSDFGADLDRRFTKLDRDTNGSLNQAEMPRRFAHRIVALDKDGDGKVSNSEFMQGSMARFDAADTNHDQALTSVEREAARLTREGNEAGSAKGTTPADPGNSQ